MSRKLHLAVACDILLNLWPLGNANILFAHPLRNLLVVLQLHPLEADGIEDIMQAIVLSPDAWEARRSLKPKLLSQRRLILNVCGVPPIDNPILGRS